MFYFPILLSCERHKAHSDPRRQAAGYTYIQGMLHCLPKDRRLDTFASSIGSAQNDEKKRESTGARFGVLAMPRQMYHATIYLSELLRGRQAFIPKGTPT